MLYEYVHLFLPDVLAGMLCNAEGVPAVHAGLIICKQRDMKLCPVRCHLFSSSSWLAFMSCCQRRICAGVLGPASIAATLVYAR